MLNDNDLHNIHVVNTLVSMLDIQKRANYNYCIKLGIILKKYGDDGFNMEKIL